jgi:hypothetical protein
LTREEAALTNLAVDFGKGLLYDPRHFGRVGLCKGDCVVEPSPQPVSALLHEWCTGNQRALELLIPLVYTDLRKIAHQHLRHERPDHTLPSAALVNEAYLSEGHPFGVVE